MIDAQTIATVKATAPLIAKTGPVLTATFYKKMLTGHPELKDVFNANNQRDGAQSTALFNAVLAYAQNIDNLPALLPAVELIAQKHASLLIKPDQYPIVGHYLLETIDEMLNPGQEVLDAWAKAYGVLADIFINREAQIYEESARETGGWRDLRPFKITHKEKLSDSITSFEFTPVDGAAIADYQAGQYISLFIKPEGSQHRHIRQYSLTRSSSNSQRGYRIAVKREAHGVVSQWLHEKAQIGDTLELAPPHGEFMLNVTPQTPVTLISAGVGITPILAMLDTLSQQQHAGQVNWLHAATNGRLDAFRDEVTRLGANLAHFSARNWYSHPEDNDRQQHRFDAEGHMELSALTEQLAANDMQFYLCGPLSFMQFVEKQLVALGINTDCIHYECFGPLKPL